MTPIVESMSWMSPATITWLALPIGILGGLSVYLATEDSLGVTMLFGGGLLITLAMAFDGLDGPVARATGRVTRWGDYLDHTLDRVLDVVWILALGYNAYWFGDFELAWTAAMLTMFGSYLGTQAQAVSGSRNYGGFSRADRMVLTFIALIATAIMAYLDTSSWGEFEGIAINPIAIIIAISALGGAYTFIVRFMKAKSELQSLDKTKPLSTPKDD